MSNESTRKYEIATGVILLFLSFGAVVVAEFGVRLQQFIKFGQVESVETSDNYYIEEGTELRLNRPDRMLGSIRINNLGHRGPDIPLEKPDNTLRLAFLGSSSTYEPYVEEGKNWPHLVATLLEERLDNCNIDFVNAGKPGYSTRTVNKLYDHHIWQTDPDLVFILANDINLELDQMAAQQGLNTDHRSYRTILSDISLFLEKVEKNFRIIQLQRGAASRQGKLETGIENFGEVYRDRLTTLVESIKERDQEPILITVSTRLREEQSLDEKVEAAATMIFYMPYLYVPDMVPMRDKYNAIIKEIGTENNVPVVEDELSIPGTGEYFVDSVHFSAAGSKVMAERVVNALASFEVFKEAANNAGCSFTQ